MLMNNFKNSNYGISKFGLGTVQFGLDYGFTKRKCQDDCGLVDYFYLLRSEPLPEAGILTDDAAALCVVCLAVHGQPKVMAGCGRVKHLNVYFGVLCGHVQGAGDHRPGVVFAVRLVKLGVAWDHFQIQIIFQGLSHAAKI